MTQHLGSDVECDDEGEDEGANVGGPIEIAALGEGWDNIDDNAPLINVSPGADLLWEAFGCHTRASAAINLWTFL